MALATTLTRQTSIFYTLASAYKVVLCARVQEPNAGDAKTGYDAAGAAGGFPVPRAGQHVPLWPPPPPPVRHNELPLRQAVGIGWAADVGKKAPPREAVGQKIATQH